MTLSARELPWENRRRWFDDKTKADHIMIKEHTLSASRPPNRVCDDVPALA